MFEVEMKFPVAAAKTVTDELAGMGARPAATIEQADQYFSHPGRDFASTDEALRVRTSTIGTVLTYKGPVVDAATKTRLEIEVPLAGGDQHERGICELLRALGFQAVGTVRKRRQAWKLEWQARPFEVAIDEVERLGTYVEIETLAAMPDRHAASQSVQQLAASLGLFDAERRSYLSLLLAQDSKKQ
jgi:adenylate cyclase class 2